MSVIKNPILKGFNPDPSIVRVGEDYYIATSTFEWFPGVQIHHSRDLKNWKLITRPLNRLSQLNMIGNPDSCGVWAPCLSYSEGLFYLVYSNVRSFDGPWKDSHNYLVTSDKIDGDWSEPVYLNSGGFDGSLFHDEDDRKWYLRMQVDHLKEKFFGGICMQEYDSTNKKLMGPVYKIFEGTELGKTEGPHLYKRNGYYYLITAEGGTEYGHAVTLARSENITGPYEVHPDNPVITSRYAENYPLQKAGHADLVETPDGDWYAVFLTGRPLPGTNRCTLGRETSIAKMEWRADDWLYTSDHKKEPPLEIGSLGLNGASKFSGSIRDDFNEPILNIHFQSLRIPVTEDWLSLKERPGYLRLFGRESLNSLHYQSLIARRVQSFHVEVTTSLDFEPENFHQMAGLVCYYNTAHYHYLYVSTDQKGKRKLLNSISSDKNRIYEPLTNPIEVSGKVLLKAVFKFDKIQFYYAASEEKWLKVGPELDGSILSDDYVRDEKNRYRPAFTGAFIGICCQDLSGQQKHADFDWFEYKEVQENESMKEINSKHILTHK